MANDLKCCALSFDNTFLATMTNKEIQLWGVHPEEKLMASVPLPEPLSDGRTHLILSSQIYPEAIAAVEFEATPFSEPSVNLWRINWEHKTLYHFQKINSQFNLRVLLFIILKLGKAHAGTKSSNRWTRTTLF